MDKDTLYTNSYVAFLDILGFKNLVTEKSCSQIAELFQNIRNPLSKMYLGTSIEIDVSEVKFKVMSDSICFHITADKEYALLSIIAVCQAFQSELLELDAPVILRGAIVRGDIYQNGDITFGPGLIDAYLLEENEVKYPRIIIKEDVLNDVIESIDDRTGGEEIFILRILYSMLYTDLTDGKRVSCVDFTETYKRSDTNGTATKALFEYVNRQIEQTTNGKREKWQYVKNQILRFYKPEES
jgi:hypothetical protein